MPDPIAQFANAKYLSLETFRKSGVGVRTPVWFAQDSASNNDRRQTIIFYIYSAPDAGKVKRVRNNPKVRTVPCTVGGKIRGVWIDGSARICTAEEASHGQKLLRQKYGMLKIVGDFFSRMRGRTQTVIAVEV